MIDLWGKRTSNLEKYNIFKYVVISIILIAVISITVYFNWGKISNLFNNDDSPQLEELQTYQPLGNNEFDALFSRVQKLEELSKQYNETNYQLRTLIYIRSGAYNTSQWAIIGGEIDENFNHYVEQNQGAYSLTSFIDTAPNESLNFTVPSTGETVDFYHLFAVMNVVYSGTQNYSDLAGWGGDLVQLINSFKNSSLTGTSLTNAVSTAFNGDSSYGFGSADVCADFDAVNIINAYKPASGKSIASTISSYYKSITKNQRVQNFKQTTFPNLTTNQQLYNEIYSRLTSGSWTNPLYLLAQSYGINFSTHSKVIETCIQVFVEHIN